MSNHPLNSAFERVNRADDHLSQLKGAIADFERAYHDAVIVEFEPDPPYQIKYTAPLDFPHPFHRIGILVGEVCYNLRAALDYLIYEMARLNSGSIQNGTQFPIEKTPQKFRGRVTTFLKGINAIHITSIERYQPYNGCRWTEILADISNPDKHRRITESVYGGFISNGSGGITPFGTPPVRSVRCAKRPDGIEVDMQLVTSMPIQIPLENPQRWVAVEDTLHQLKADVAMLLMSFNPEFK